MRRWLRTLHAYLELSRVSNLPTCWTNVVVGCAVGGWMSGGQPFELPWVVVVLVGIAISLMYAGGMALNDACDAAIDARERPGRPIPSGRISRRAACVYAGWCLGLGLAILTIAGMPAALLGAVLVACIITYDAIHQRIAASVILMGACRGLVYLVAAAAIAWPLDWLAAGTFAGSMCWYVMILSVVARRETEVDAPARRRLLVGSMFLAFPAPVLVVTVGGPTLDSGEPFGWWSIGPGLAASAWMLWSARFILAARPVAVRAVLGWLAGICLIDAFYLALLAPHLQTHWLTPVAVALACFVLTLLGHRRILGT